MALPAIPFLVLTTALSYIGQQRQAKAAERAREQAVEIQNRRIALEAAAAQRAHQARMAALGTQTGIANRGSEAFTRDVQNQLGNVNRDIEQTTTKRRENLDRALGRDAAGEAGSRRQVGSETKGRVSESFAERGEGAGKRIAAKTGRRADRMATLGAFNELPAQAGRQASEVVRRQLPFQRERRSQAAIDRLKIARASMIPQEGTHFIDSSDPLGQVLQGLGQGALDWYGYGGGFGRPTTTSGGGGTGVSNVQTYTRR